MKNIIYLFVSLILLAISYLVAFNENIIVDLGYASINFDNKLPILIPILILSLYSFIMFLNAHEPKKLYQCPNCKEHYQEHEINEGKCPNCYSDI